MNANEALKIFREGKKARDQELQIAHGTHRPDTGWAEFGHPGPEDKGSPHKQYLPDGSPIYDDGSGNTLPWDQRPVSQGLPQEQLMANRPAGMPEYIYESIQRQYGNKKYGNYTIEDKKNVINWYKKMQVDAGSGGQNIANVWAHETPSDTFNRQNYPGRGASDDLRIDHMRRYHGMKKKELA